MPREQSPAFQFYPQDFLSDDKVSLMSAAARGAYITLLCHCWLSQTIPADDASLCSLARLNPRSASAILRQLRPCFYEVDGGLRNKRIEHEREKQAQFRESGRRGGQASAKARARLGQAKSNSSSSSSSSSSDPLVEIQAKEREQASTTTPEKPASLSPAARAYENPKTDPFLDDVITKRAAEFIDRYQVLYPERRNGARYAVKPTRDYAAAVTLCQTWADDKRLEKLAVVFLTTDHKFAEEGSRTIPQFLALASWCDSKLAEWEQTHGRRTGGSSTRRNGRMGAEGEKEPDRARRHA